MVPSLLHRPLSVYRYAPKKIPSRFLTVTASIGWYAVDPAIPGPVVSDGGIQTSVMSYGVSSTSSRRSCTLSTPYVKEVRCGMYGHTVATIFFRANRLRDLRSASIAC